MYRTFALLLVCGATAAPQDAAVSFTFTPTSPIPGETYSSRTEDIPTYPTVQTEPDVPDTSNAGAELTETTEAVTERDEPRTTLHEVRPKPPKFYSKLSYFEKPESSAVLTNLLEKPGRRRFRSRCRCEKISNCPKLQISVPRCPNEQFMCCF